MKSVLYSTVAVHRHAQEMARAFSDEGRLGLWHTSWIHAPGLTKLGTTWQAASAFFPGLKKVVARRSLIAMGKTPLQMRWKTEMARVALENIPRMQRLGHLVWEWQEQQLAREAANYLAAGKYKRYLGLEHGSLEALRACRKLGLRSCLVFTSPHHTFSEKWAKTVNPNFRPGDHLGVDGEKLMRRCYSRVDEEITLADLIRTNSELVRQSLIGAGVDPKKVVSVPLGADATQIRPFEPKNAREPMRFIVSGNVSLKKGSLVLLQAWKELNPAGAELHFYGKIQVAREKLAGLPDNVFLHGKVTPDELGQAYRKSQVLIFPTLCDGFGMVVPEAMVEGCAVLTTRNAGAADWVEEGKNGWVVEAGSVSALQEGLEKVFACQGNLEEMRVNAQATARKNTWEKFRRQFMATLETQGFLN